MSLQVDLCFVQIIFSVMFSLSLPICNYAKTLSSFVLAIHNALMHITLDIELDYDLPGIDTWVFN